MLGYKSLTTLNTMTNINFVEPLIDANKVPNLQKLEELLVWSATLYASINNAREIQLAPNAVPISLASVADTKAADNKNYVGILVYVPLVANYHALPLPTWKKVQEVSTAIGSDDFNQDY